MSEMIGHQYDTPGVVADDAVRTMRERGGRWAAYQSVDMSSITLGAFQFLRVGEAATIKTPPRHMPDNPQSGPGWRWIFVGFVNLDDGSIVTQPPEEIFKSGS